MNPAASWREQRPRTAQSCLREVWGGNGKQSLPRARWEEGLGFSMATHTGFLFNILFPKYTEWWAVLARTLCLPKSNEHKRKFQTEHPKFHWSGLNTHGSRRERDLGNSVLFPYRNLTCGHVRGYDWHKLLSNVSEPCLMHTVDSFPKQTPTQMLRNATIACTLIATSSSADCPVLTQQPYAESVLV